MQPVCPLPSLLATGHTPGNKAGYCCALIFTFQSRYGSTGPVVATRLRTSKPVDVDAAPGTAALPRLPQQRVAKCPVVDRQAVTSISKLSWRRHSAKAKATCANRHITTTYWAAIHDPARVNLPSPVPLPTLSGPDLSFNHYNEHNRQDEPRTCPQDRCQYRSAQIGCQNFQDRKQTKLKSGGRWI